MKFACERCGKRYATAEEPAPGRVYKLKCKACGHLMVVKAPATAAPAAPAPVPPPVLAPVVAAPPVPAPQTAAEPVAPEPPPEPPVVTDAPRPPEHLEPDPEITAPVPMRAPRAGESTPDPWAMASPPPVTDVSGDGLDEARAPAAGGPGAEDPGYVDPFSDMRVDEDAARQDADPLLAAARASLPDGYGEGNPAAPDPLAALGDAAGGDARATPAASKVPAFARPQRRRSVLPIALIAVGLVVLIGILAFVLLGSRRSAPPPARPRAGVLAPGGSAPEAMAALARATPAPRRA